MNDLIWIYLVEPIATYDDGPDENGRAWLVTFSHMYGIQARRFVMLSDDRPSHARVVDAIERHSVEDPAP